jgi:hypothetical protein
MIASMPQEIAMRALFHACLLLAAVPAAAQTSTYSGEQAREIKALSAEETADLLAGRGMGLARAAELNQYPGPMHVLALAQQLGLTDAQRALIEASSARMSAAAKVLGAEIVEHERALDVAFKRQSVSTEQLVDATAAIAALQGQLRAAHLAAHLETRAVLTADQVTLYDRLRGYAGDAPSATHRGHPG